MTVSQGSDAAGEPAGYLWLAREYGLRVRPPRHQSQIAAGGTRRTTAEGGLGGGVVRDLYPPRYDPGPTLAGHLTFALKHDGVDLGILAALFGAVEPDDVAAVVRARPTGRYARRAWFLHELLTGRTLDLPDAAAGGYVDALDARAYYTAAPARSPRHRVNDNLPGTRAFCPVVRRTETLAAFERDRLDERCRRVAASFPPALLRRAASYLYLKETKSSFAIEAESPPTSRLERFAATLARAGRGDAGSLDEASLAALQNRIVDPRYAEPSFRAVQNYVGESVSWTEERVHLVPPKPGDVRGLMAGLAEADRRMGGAGSAVPPVAHAAAVAFAFVFVHPFKDGNGRLHRYLIHDVLARRGFTPPGLVVPVSAAMLADPAGYDAALEAFSRPLLGLVDYDLDDRRVMTVRGETAAHYRYPDLTAQAEALAGFARRAVDEDLAGELEFLARHDAARSAVRAAVDLPDRRLDLLIRLVAQNGGRLSARKRQSQFAELADAEVAAAEAAVAEAFGGDAPAAGPDAG